MALPTISELEESLLVICEELADNTLNNVARKDSSVKVEIENGNAHIKVRDRNRSTGITMQTDEIERKVKERRAGSEPKPEQKKEDLKDRILG